MRTFAIHTLGCKANQYESQQIRELLEKFGLKESTSNNKPDLVVVNTCCVTQKASAKSRQAIRKMQKHNPAAILVACGCLPAADLGELNGIGENIQLIRNRQKTTATLSELAHAKTKISRVKNPLLRHDIVIRTLNSPKIKHKNSPNWPELPQLTAFRGHTRAFLKVQDGCDGYCSYCIVPKTRPQVTSRPIYEVVSEAQKLVEAGHKEIILTGIFLGAYGQKSVKRNNWTNNATTLAELLEEIAKIPNLQRIRLSSLEPADVTPALLETFRKHQKIMPHLHLSLQSGSDHILAKMARQYRIKQFLDTIESIRSSLDRPAITTDIIAGFPGETQDDFAQTTTIAEKVGFAKMHIFAFSPRKGTAAARMPDQLDPMDIRKRCNTLRQLNSTLEQRFRQQFVGQDTTVLIESTDGQAKGRAERYFTVTIGKTNRTLTKNDIVKVKLIENTQTGLIGTPI